MPAVSVIAPVSVTRWPLDQGLLFEVKGLHSNGIPDLTMYVPEEAELDEIVEDDDYWTAIFYIAYADLWVAHAV